MEGTSEVILRNETRMGTAPLLLVNPPRDGLVPALQSRPGLRAELRCSSQDFGDSRWLRAGGLDVRYEVVPTLAGDEGLVVLHLPREKERLAMLLHALATAWQESATAPPRLWLVGENRAGIKSAGSSLRRWFGRFGSLDKARHCGLWEAAQPLPVAPFALDGYLRDWQIAFAGREIRLRSLPGVFAHGRLDAGTALLLQVLERLRPRGTVLDFACGSGVVGLALRIASDAVVPTLLDSSALALESSRRSLQANGIEPDRDAHLLPSDGLSEVSGRFEWIVSNPPFHRGVRSDLDVAADFIRHAGTLLSKTGRIVVVFNRHLPYAAWLADAFNSVERLAHRGEYQVVLAAGPRVGGDTGRTR
jgi:16S rRNA (guanine1207-N2)-methyltransferase